ncbi:MAG: hypothetical protein LBT90_00830 [Holosporaceae bacterium]|nr:hypothetical protein [Holosporaceae bacterium]
MSNNDPESGTDGNCSDDITKERSCASKGCNAGSKSHDAGSKNRSMSKWKIIAIIGVITIIILVCAVIEHFCSANYCAELNGHSGKEMQRAMVTSQKDHNNQQESFLAKLNELHAKLDELQRKLNELADKSKALRCEHCHGKAMRKKWKVWVALRSKLEAEEPLKEELKAFNAVFARDDELIKLVANLAKNADTVADEETKKEKILDTCRQYFSRIIRLKKVDNNELSKISGYVLSSTED